MTTESQAKQALHRKRRNRKWKFWLLKIFVMPPLWLFIQLYFNTLRIDPKDRQKVIDFLHEQSPVPVVFWHTHLVLTVVLLYRMRFDLRTQLSILVSPSKDGDLIEGILKSLNHEVVRGSSSKSAVRSLIMLRRELERGMNVCIPVDGPKGPRGVPKEGIVLLTKAQRNSTMVSVIANAPWFFALNSWDKTILPLPFSRITFEADLLTLESGESRESFLARLQHVALKHMDAAGQPTADIMRLKPTEPEQPEDTA